MLASQRNSFAARGQAMAESLHTATITILGDDYPCAGRTPASLESLAPNGGGFAGESQDLTIRVRRGVAALPPSTKVLNEPPAIGTEVLYRLRKFIVAEIHDAPELNSWRLILTDPNKR